MKITLPELFRHNFRYFFAHNIGCVGFLGGISGKCIWFYIVDATQPDFIQSKEDIASFYVLRNK